MRTILLVSFAAGLFILGCTSLERLQTAQDDQLCPSTIEGRFFSRLSYIGKVPALYARRHKDFEVMIGEILRIDTGGILFKPERESAFYSADSEYFPNDRIGYCVDSAGYIVRGEIPNRKQLLWGMELELQNDDHPKAPHRTAWFKPNERFAFCIDAGVWTVTKITLRSGTTHEDICEQPPVMKISVAKNSINYIGELSLDMKPDTLPGVHKIAINRSNRPGGSAGGYYVPVATSQGSVAAGIIGGAIGGALFAALGGGHRDVEFLHTFSVDADTFTSVTRVMQPERSLMTVVDTTEQKKND